MHAIIAQYIESIISAPVQVTRLNQRLQSMVRSNRATLDSRYQQIHQSANPAGTLGAFGGYSGGYQRYAGNRDTTDGGANTNTMSPGLNYQLTDSVLRGGMIADSLDNQRPDDGYRFDTRSFQTSLFSHLQYDQAWLDGDVHYLTAVLNNIRRSITLGELTRVEEGARTRGKLWGARLAAGYDFIVTPWLSAGPMLQYLLDYSQATGTAKKRISAHPCGLTTRRHTHRWGRWADDLLPVPVRLIRGFGSPGTISLAIMRIRLKVV